MLLADELSGSIQGYVYFTLVSQSEPLEERSESLGMALTAFKGPSHRSE